MLTEMQVYVTMYLNDCQRTDFYEGIGQGTIFYATTQVGDS